MAWRIAFLSFCLDAGGEVIGVRSSVNLETEFEEAVQLTESLRRVTDDEDPTFCSNNENPPNHTSDLVATMSGDPNFLYNVITNGLLGWTELMIALKKSPPDVKKGYSDLSIKLWECVLQFIDKDQQDSKWMKNAKKEWDAGWAKAPDIDAQVRSFQESGDAAILATAIGDVATTTLTIASSSICVPSMTKVFDGLEFLIDGICDATVSYAKGNTTQAMTNFWNGLNNSVYAVTTQEQRENASWAGFYKETEKRAAELFEFIADWHVAVLQSDLCHRISVPRELRQASFCPSGYTWDQLQYCKPDKYHGIDCGDACPDAVATGGGPCQTFCQGSGTGIRYCCKRNFGANRVCRAAQYVSLDGGQWTDASNYFQCVDPVIFGLLETSSKSVEESMIERAIVQGKRSSVDRSARRKCFFGFCWGKDKPVVTDPYGLRNASCDPLSLFPDRAGNGQCSQKCQGGWIVNPAQTSDCISICEAPKPWAGKLGFKFGSVGAQWPVCAKSENHLTVANTDMGMLAINTVAAVQKAVVDVLKDNSISETSMDGIAEAMKTIALNFAIPQCPNPSVSG